MEASLNMQQKLETKLSLTPQARQSLEILKYSLVELENFIKEEAEANPLIELKEIDSKHILEMARIHAPEAISSMKDESFDPLLQVPNREESMEAFLMEQLVLLKHLSKKDREIVLYLIRNLNDLGYLDCDIEEIAERFQLSIERCEELIAVLQSLEPAGIGARNLAECLYLQVVRKQDAPQNTVLIIQNHLEVLAEGDFQRIAKLYGMTNEEVENLFSYIKQLNPRPLREFLSSKQEYIIPDIIVEEMNGEYVIHLNDRYLPEVSINTYYVELLRANASGEIKEYLNTKLSEAFLLMRGIEQRHETLFRVTESIVEKQRAFLKNGKKELVPFRLKDVAESLGLHESTVSRTISQKFIQTPQGTLPLKTFFVRGVRIQGGEVESPLFIKEKIRAIIENEDTLRPLSDQKIANILLAEGIPIARRTVAKYREELGISQSTKRRRKK
ncbi:RNA polymerase factor sigma-54 [Ureibacillus chungkukjangi]|uniref:RNA polymerase factor sigma-54 n=1 Tax=Ureibacillus chungkukjangi TaxID=1202712 RepID=UPI00203DEBB2|nr:RNA polymerase factor sigma-54 [Ureibacillus chungkukjangi]MCM3389605.1 RNA polymerase factor sigma-54 [Ureibacillus chungkukjangi]